MPRDPLGFTQLSAASLKYMQPTYPCFSAYSSYARKKNIDNLVYPFFLKKRGKVAEMNVLPAFNGCPYARAHFQ
jgi:hypothetical protein